MKNNKGLTLVELVVSIAILSLVGIGVGTIINQSLRQYRMSNTEVSLQQEAQLAGNQLTNLVIDANDGVSAEAGKLNIYDYDLATRGRGKIVIAFDATNGMLTYSRYEMADGDEDWTPVAGETEELFADYVKEFTVEFLNEDGAQIAVTGDAGGKDVYQVCLKIRYELQGKSYDYEQTITLRNQILASNIVEGSFDDEVDPEEPGSEGSEEPGTGDTEKPGTEDPEEPGTEDSEEPGTEKPAEPVVNDITVRASTSSGGGMRTATVTITLTGANLPTDDAKAQAILSALKVTVFKRSWSLWGNSWTDVTDDLRISQNQISKADTSYTITYVIENCSSWSSYMVEAEYETKSDSSEFSFW